MNMESVQKYVISMTEQEARNLYNAIKAIGEVPAPISDLYDLLSHYFKPNHVYVKMNRSSPI